VSVAVPRDPAYGVMVLLAARPFVDPAVIAHPL